MATASTARHCTGLGHNWARRTVSAAVVVTGTDERVRHSWRSRRCRSRPSGSHRRPGKTKSCHLQDIRCPDIVKYSVFVDAESSRTYMHKRLLDFPSADFRADGEFEVLLGDSCKVSHAQPCAAICRDPGLQSKYLYLPDVSPSVAGDDKKQTYTIMTANSMHRVKKNTPSM